MEVVTLKVVTLEQFKGFKPCWLEEEGGPERLERIGSQKAEWTALDVLNLEEVSAKDRIWAVCREEFIDAPILHEFACRCAEEALKLVKNPDPRSVVAIEAKRKWLECEISDEELRAARDADMSVVRDAAWYAVWYAAGYAARSAARSAASGTAARESQLKILRELLENDQK